MPKIERRRFRRAEVEVSATLRSLNPTDSTQALKAQVQDVSLGGAYCHLPGDASFNTGDEITFSIPLPPHQTRVFPFSRIVGRGWVTRLESIPTGRRAGESPSNEKLQGLALCFAEDATALGTIDVPRA